MLFCSYILTQWHIKNAYFPFDFFSLPELSLMPLFFSHLLDTVNKVLAYSQL